MTRLSTPTYWLILLIAVVSVLLFCDAPRTNPLDVHNPDNQWAELSGTVVRAGTSPSPLENVILLWNDEDYAVSDENGRFVFRQIRPVDGWLRYFREGYQEDSLFIAWDGRNKITQNLELVAMPTIQGYVKTIRVPPQPIAGVKITWSAAQQFVYTDDDGFYQFEDLAPENGTLTFEKEGFRTEVDTVDWQEGPVISKDIFLNANPTLDSLSLNSVVEHNYGDRTVEQLQTFAYIDDVEGDIQTVSLACSPLDIDVELFYNVQHKRYERSFSVLDLGINSMRQLVGYDFHLMVQDDNGYTFDLSQDRVERVILDEIEIDSPKNSQQVNNLVTLKWLYFNPGFPFTYDVEIYTDDDFTQELVWHKQGVPSDSLSIAVDELLDSKEYVWMVWCVDQFQNRSRSKPGSFSVVE